MKSDSQHPIVFLMIVIGRKRKDALLSVLSDLGVPLTCTIYGKGTVDAGYLENVFGFVPEEKKAIVTCMLLKEKSDVIMDMLVEKFNFDKPNTGVAFAIPIDRLLF